VHASGGQAVGSFESVETPLRGASRQRRARTVGPAFRSRGPSHNPGPDAHGDVLVAFLVCRQGEAPWEALSPPRPVGGRPACPRVDGGSQGRAGEQLVNDRGRSLARSAWQPKIPLTWVSQRVPAPTSTVTLRLPSLLAGIEAPVDTIAVHIAGAGASVFEASRVAEAPVLSITRCRQLAGGLPGMNDEQVSAFRDLLYGLAGCVLDAHRASLDLDRSERLSTDHHSAVDERAAILEFDAGLTRAASQRTALDLHLKSSPSRASRRQGGTLQ
jgi:hypothetical protein